MFWQICLQSQPPEENALQFLSVIAAWDMKTVTVIQDKVHLKDETSQRTTVDLIKMFRMYQKFE